jgi:spore coat protein U-like protein
MKIRNLKTVYGILLSLLLLAGTVHATTLTPASGITLAAATINRAYTSVTLTAGGCIGGTYNWTAAGLPAGLTLNSTTGTTNTIHGTPTASGSFTINVTVTHTGCAPNSVTNTYYLTVNPALALTPATNTAVSPNAIRNVAYTSTTIFTASGGTQPYTWTTPTNLPAGLSLSATSGNNIYITGTPTAAAGTYTFRVRVTEYNGSRVTNTYTITISNTGCDFVNGVSTGSISFGNIDPTAGGTIYGTVTTGVQFTCSSALAYTIIVSPASGWQMTSGSNTITYTLGVASNGTYGTTAVNVFPSSSTNMIQGQYVNAPAGIYSNTAISVTISWSGGSIVASGSVSGTVLKACLVTGSATLSFGTLDAATNAGGATATGTPLSIMCTMGDVITVTNNGGLNYSGTPQMISGTNYVPYNFSSASSLTGAGGTTNIGGNLALGGTISAGALDNVPSGTYSDTITLTINY